MDHKLEEGDLYCPMAHNGLQLTLDTDPDVIGVNNCCLMSDSRFTTKPHPEVWDDVRFLPVIETNKKNQWYLPSCGNCHEVEKAGHVSFRQGTYSAWGKEERLSGPRRIDLSIKNSCNLACRICGPGASTYWQKHIKDNGSIPIMQIPDGKGGAMDFNSSDFRSRNGKEQVEILKSFDLSNLRSLTFCGGETLMGNDNWEVMEYLATLPHAKESLMISFQTNGTQEIPLKRHELLDKFWLIKLHISIDGIEERFNYQRWPGDWHQVENNLLKIREDAPSNVMFLIEETIGVFNLPYIGQVADWREKNFNANRDGDPVEHTHHVAQGMYHLRGATQEYWEFSKSDRKYDMIPNDWKEDPELIKKMLAEIKLHDGWRNQRFEDSLPEVAEFYKRYL